MARSSWFGLLFFWVSIVACAGCTASLARDGGTDDAAMGVDGAGADASADAGSLDANLADAGSDAGAPRDASNLDAGELRDPAAARALADAVCPARAFAACAAPWACGCDGSPAPDESACIVERTSACEADLEGVETVLGLDGLRTIDPAMVEACAATLRASYEACLAPPELENVFACIHMWRSPVAIGSYCMVPGLCANGEGFCRAGERCVAVPTSEDASCTTRCGGALACIGGRCSEPLSEGGACTDDEDCAPPHRCTGGACGPGLAAGAACTTDARCAVGLACSEGACEVPSETSCDRAMGRCPSGSECVGNREPRCYARRAIGQTCGGDEYCGADAYCDFTSWPGICAARRGVDAPCSSGGCLPELVCDYFPERGDAFCAEPMQLGQPCAFRSCAPELACVDGLCSPIPALGDRCEGRCEPGLFCDWASNTCVLAGSEGEVCDDGFSYRECGVELGCFYDGSGLGRCGRLPATGERCEESGACRDGAVCAWSDRGTAVCVPPAAEGDVCFGVCADPEQYCGEDLDRGICIPMVCAYLDDGRIEPPRPEPLPLP